MKLVVDTTLLKGLSLEEFLILWAATNRGTPADQVYTDLGLKGFGQPLFDLNGQKVNGFVVSTEGRDFVNNVLSQSAISDDNRDLKTLAQALKDLYPKGKKDGTNLPWTEGVALIEKRLKMFFKKYGEYPHENIIRATQKYVEGHNGNYRLMRTLKYFIWKEERGAAGDVESTSDLLTYLENAGEEENLRNDWTSTIV
nr:MAG TPA: hypothetical protein [Crassvirales sp.]